MAKILVYMAPARGSIYPIIPVLEQLQEKGHEALAIAPSGMQVTLRWHGIEAVPMSDAVEFSYLPATNQEEDYCEYLDHDLQLRLNRAIPEVQELERTVAECNPDMLLISSDLLGATAWAEGSGLRWSSWSTRLLPFPASGIPQFGPGNPLKQSAFGGLLKGWGKSNSVPKVYDKYRTTFNDLRTSCGAMAVGNFEEWTSYLSNLIYFTFEPFEYRRHWPENVSLAGPSLWDPFEEELQLNDDGRPLILVSACCDYQGEEKLISTVLQSIDSRKYQVVITTAAIDPEGFIAPDGVTITRFASHNSILQRAACVICPGNLGLTQRALYYGVPVLAVTAFRDQLEVGQRLKNLKIGVTLPLAQLTPQNLVENLNKTMACKPNVASLQTELSQHDSIATSVYVIEHALGLH